MDYEQLIENNYQIKVNSIHLIDSHFGTEIYRLIHDNSEYILKSYPLHMKGAKNEGDIAEHLWRNGVNVARFLRTSNSAYSVTTDSSIVTIQEFRQGDTLQVNSAPDWFLDESARILGRINSVLSDYEKLPLQFEEDFFTKSKATSKKEQFEKELLTAKHNSDTALVWRFNEQIRHLSKISEFGIDTSKLTYSNSHGDFHIGQAIVQSGNITIIDWASACRLPVCLEVITSFVFASPKCKDGSIDSDALKHYTSIYCEHFHLSEYDVKTMPYVLYFWHCMCNYSPQERVPDSYQFTAKLIENLLNWLFENVEMLSERLLTK